MRFRYHCAAYVGMRYEWEYFISKPGGTTDFIRPGYPRWIPGLFIFDYHQKGFHNMLLKERWRLFAETLISIENQNKKQIIIYRR